MNQIASEERKIDEESISNDIRTRFSATDAMTQAQRSLYTGGEFLHSWVNNFSEVLKKLMPEPVSDVLKYPAAVLLGLLILWPVGWVSGVLLKILWAFLTFQGVDVPIDDG